MTRLPANYVDSQRESTLATNENLQRAASYAPRRRSDFLQRSDSHAQLESDTRMKNFYDGLMSNGDSDKGHLDATKLTKLLRESGLNDQASDWEDFTYWLTEVDIDFASVLDTTSRHALFMNLPDRNTIVGIRQLLLDQFDKARPPGKKPFSEWLRFDPDSPSVSFESKTIADLTICLVIEKMYVDKAKYMSKTVDVGAVRTDFLAHSQQRVTDSEEMIQRIQDYKMDFIRKGHIFDVFCKYYGIGEETLGKLERITSYFDEKSGRFEIDDDSYNLLFTTLLVSEGIDNNTLSAYLRFLHPELSQDQLQWFADLRSAMAGKVGRLETKIDPLHPAPYGR